MLVVQAIIHRSYQPRSSAGAIQLAGSNPMPWTPDTLASWSLLDVSAELSFIRRELHVSVDALHGFISIASFAKSLSVDFPTPSSSVEHPFYSNPIGTICS